MERRLRRAATVEKVRWLALVVVLSAALATGGCGEDQGARTDAAETPATVGGEKMIVAALGDSITAGSPLWDPDPAARRRIGAGLDPESQYEYWAELRLDGVEFRNCGVFGERTDEIATRLEDCGRGADALIVQGGINDIAQGRAVEDAAADLDAMVGRGQQLGLTTAVVDVLPWNNGYPDADPKIRALNRLIHDIGRTRGVPVFPFYATLEDPSNPGRMRAEWTIDGDHPSVVGYRRLGDLIELP